MNQVCFSNYKVRVQEPDRNTEKTVLFVNSSDTPRVGEQDSKTMIDLNDVPPYPSQLNVIGLTSDYLSAATSWCPKVGRIACIQ